ncbi:hypothetical protein GALMADRAFT_1136387 [Galerina marginata CBS 339.88]|uniref:Uncharacterized protein n=1 Tax=Galerina marginata (strain CBS 339.88) TaxID=685588 RepID=A0A067SAF7_GALM3|nr:hypothetical protein GALMADRAFT_1136387 [Galerina marginata CBS 339.88]
MFASNFEYGDYHRLLNQKEVDGAFPDHWIGKSSLTLLSLTRRSTKPFDCLHYTIISPRIVPKGGVMQTATTSPRDCCDCGLLATNEDNFYPQPMILGFKDGFLRPGPIIKRQRSPSPLTACLHCKIVGLPGDAICDGPNRTGFI